jgi:RimJ/RimL family protein N-acetyltransferase
LGDVPILETGRLRLRAWRYEDIDPLSEIYAHPDVRRFLPYVDRDGTEWQVAFIVAHWVLEGFGLWAVEDRATGRFLGRIGLNRQVDFRDDPAQVEVGWTLSPDVWGRGLATEGALAALAHGFDALSLPRIISLTVPDNARSRRVMERCGLTYRGETFFRDLHHVWYAIDRTTWLAWR